VTSVTRAADISADERYRYWLHRCWDPAAPQLVVIGLNPSTADGYAEDATSRRCIALAGREQCGSLLIVNLFAYRSTNPAELGNVDDPVGPGNDDHIAAAVTSGGPVVVAWGDGGHNGGRVAKVTALRAAEVSALIDGLGVPTRCLGRTKAGHPRHPLRLRNDTPLQPFSPRPTASHLPVGIGYQGRDLNGFLAEIAALGVQTVVDVRLNPVSRKPGFSRRALKAALEQIGVRYQHEPALGNPADNRAGFAGAPPELVSARERFRQLMIGSEASAALNRIAEESRDSRMALLCFESDQQCCHRDVLLEGLQTRLALGREGTNTLT
jgi:hypothetical protein